MDLCGVKGQGGVMVKVERGLITENKTVLSGDLASIYQ